MSKRKKIFQEIRKRFFEKNLKTKDVNDLLPFLKESCLSEKYKRNFDQAVDIVINLNLKKGVSIKDSVVLPYSFLKNPPRILVFAKGQKAEEAEKAGAQYVGAEEYISKIQQGWLDFDVILATPDMMKDVSRLGQILGRKGLMPNPKLGTVGFSLSDMILQFKKGKSIFQANKNGVLAFKIGLLSMDSGHLIENVKAFYKEVLSKRPKDHKGEFIRSVYLNATMSPSLRISFN